VLCGLGGQHTIFTDYAPPKHVNCLSRLLPPQSFEASTITRLYYQTRLCRHRATKSCFTWVWLCV